VEGSVRDEVVRGRFGLKGKQAASDFSYSKELQTKALNFIARGIAAKKTASADLLSLSRQ